MNWWTDLAPREFEFHFSGSLISTFLVAGGQEPYRRYRIYRIFAGKILLPKQLQQLGEPQPYPLKREVLIDNPLVRNHWTGLAPWEFELPYPITYPLRPTPYALNYTTYTSQPTPYTHTLHPTTYTSHCKL